jgi:hypothetical protein
MLRRVRENTLAGAILFMAVAGPHSVYSQEAGGAVSKQPRAHYLANLGEAGISPEEARKRVREHLSNPDLEKRVKATFETIRELLGLKANLMFLDLSGLSAQYASRYASAIRDVSLEFPTISESYPDGTILVAMELMEDKFLKDGLRKTIDFLLKCAPADELSVVSINGIMAHELAHLLQDKLNLPLGSKEREVHADFMSGWALPRPLASG